MIISSCCWLYVTIDCDVFSQENIWIQFAKFGVTGLSIYTGVNTWAQKGFE